MTDKKISPFDELHAMLLYGSETPLTTVGEVKQQLAGALQSQGISRLNNTIAMAGLAKLIESITQQVGPHDSDALFLRGLESHIQELMETEELALARDIIVMESWLSYMDVAAGKDRRGEDIPF